mmetsp:Transcript_2470/g.7372  ORF Transcript_2470/g.7372 Transcript_2470/m.7372 type:complete len:437 (+) Transcript_2470:152-1462(+)
MYEGNWRMESDEELMREEARGDGMVSRWLSSLQENAALILCTLLLVGYTWNLQSSKSMLHQSRDNFTEQLGQAHQLDQLEQNEQAFGGGNQEVSVGGSFGAEPKLEYGPAGVPVTPGEDSEKNPTTVPGIFTQEITSQASTNDQPSPPQQSGSEQQAVSAPSKLTPGKSMWTSASTVPPTKAIEKRPVPETFNVDALMQSPLASRLIVDKKLKAVYCPLPKVACSNWKALFRMLNGYSDYKNLALAHDKSQSGLKYLKDFSKEEVKGMLADPEYLKFVFVREPYSRLLSSYLDKFTDRLLSSPEFLKFFDQLVGYKHRKEGKEAFVPTFEQFIKFVDRQKPEEMNEHWAPQIFLCQVGSFPYDYIGRFEKYAEDANNVLHALKQATIRFPSQADLNFASVGTTSKMQSFYTDELRSIVAKKYADEFEKLEYDPKQM